MKEMKGSFISVVREISNGVFELNPTFVRFNWVYF